MNKLRVLTVFGTRPESIKLVPVIWQLQKHPELAECIVCVTAQHREMLDQMLHHFRIHPDMDLNIMETGQTLTALTVRLLGALSEVIEKTRPDLLMVQGDTTTATAAALAGFYHKVPVGHVEAGLRTGNRYSPFPEEINRRIITTLGSYHFAPTDTAWRALRSEGVPAESIFVTGNTSIDALLWTVQQSPSSQALDLLRHFGLASLPNDGLAPLSPSGTATPKLVLVTAHRRESFGPPLENICLALRKIADKNPEVVIVYPVHLNPHVWKTAHRVLANHDRIFLVEPLDYEHMVRLMCHAHLILTDSGGIQEEAPSLGKPVLVLRNDTERPEAVEAGTAKVVGTETNDIVDEAERLLHDEDEYQRMSQAVNPFGDGHASERIVDAILKSRVGTLK